MQFSEVPQLPPPTRRRKRWSSRRSLNSRHLQGGGKDGVLGGPLAPATYKEEEKMEFSQVS